MADVNPWEAPEQRGTGAAPRCRWRRRWKRICLASIGLHAAFLLAHVPFRDGASSSSEAPYWLVIVMGLIALGILASALAAGIAGIGWVLAPRGARVRDE